jgi:iron complex transport system ATP-binding protein
MKTAIDIHHLSHSYGTRPVLSDVTFSVAAGEFFIIIGPNGSGKTTLLKTLAGIDTLQTGRVKIFDRAIGRYSRKALAKTLSFVPQSMPLDFPFSVMQTVLMGRYPHLGVLGIEGEADLAVARRALEFTGVTHLAERKMDQLSGGERQRAFIARALCQEPKLLLLDEPTAALDLAHQGRVMDLMEQLKREAGTTVLMVSHDVNLAAMYADRLLLLKEGQIIALGTPRQVMTYEILESVYGCPLLVDETSLDRLPRITLVPRRFLSTAQSGETTPERKKINRG